MMQLRSTCISDLYLRVWLWDCLTVGLISLYMSIVIQHRHTISRSESEAIYLLKDLHFSIARYCKTRDLHPTESDNQTASLLMRLHISITSCLAIAQKIISISESGTTCLMMGLHLHRMMLRNSTYLRKHADLRPGRQHSYILINVMIGLVERLSACLQEVKRVNMNAHARYQHLDQSPSMQHTHAFSFVTILRVKPLLRTPLLYTLWYVLGKKRGINEFAPAEKKSCRYAMKVHKQASYNPSRIYAQTKKQHVDCLACFYKEGRQTKNT